MRIEFATRECGRCGGSGYRTEFHTVARGVCFQCQGRGRVLTRDGQAAREYYEAAKEAAFRAPVESVRPGDVVTSGGSTFRVASVERGGMGHVDEVTGRTVWHVGLTDTRGICHSVRPGENVQRHDRDAWLVLTRETVKRFPRGARITE